MQTSPQCSSPKTMTMPGSKASFCYACKHELVREEPVAKLRIFLSYGHDTSEGRVRRIKSDLEKRGHDAWFDKAAPRFGDDWWHTIAAGIVGSNAVCLRCHAHPGLRPEFLTINGECRVIEFCKSRLRTGADVWL